MKALYVNLPLTGRPGAQRFDSRCRCILAGASHSSCGTSLMQGNPFSPWTELSEFRSPVSASNATTESVNRLSPSPRSRRGDLSRRLRPSVEADHADRL
jgi:hypothetical protein